MKLPRKQAATNPLDFPLEVSMLFERAAYQPVRVPEAGKGFDTSAKAMGARMVLARWKAQMCRHPETIKQWKSLISTIQFTNPVQDEQGWCFYIQPFAHGSGVVALAKGIVADQPTPSMDEFWATYKGVE